MGRYPADLDTAHRLHAARLAAGYKSIRALSRAKGWSEAAFRAHETANRKIEPATAEIYAAGLDVTTEWLLRGRGKGPPIDPVRRARFAVRQFAEPEPHEVPPQARRLRLARRLAGYGSVYDAAAALGLTRSTLSAHEVGQNALSAKTAALYAGAFGCAARWLLDGQLPSGYPPRVEDRLGDLLDLYDGAETDVRPEFERLDFLAPTAPVRDRPAGRSGGEPQPAVGDLVPELSEASLLRLVATSDRANTAREGTLRRWFLPPGEIMASFHTAPALAAIMTVGRSFAVAEAGDRLILDLGSTSPVNGNAYLIIGPDGRLDAVTWGNGGPAEVTVIARVAGVIRALRA